jgi:hypothetical protein
MQINIISVAVSKVKTYNVADVTYSDYRGETKTWKLFSFSNPATFAILKDAKAGESYEITTGKNDKDYTIWTGATKTQGPAAAAPAATVASGGKREWVPDADRQRLIVKQSCLAQAIAFANLTKPDVIHTDDVLEVADIFVAYVYDVPALEEDASTN